MDQKLCLERIYSADSTICRKARHAGSLGNELCDAPGDFVLSSLVPFACRNGMDWSKDRGKSSCAVYTSSTPTVGGSRSARQGYRIMARLCALGINTDYWILQRQIGSYTF